MVPDPSASEPDVRDEGFHAPGPEEQWSDSFYLGGGDAHTAVAPFTIR